MIYYIRHGQTNYNKRRIIQGHINSNLNQTGIDQANKIAEDLKNIKLDYIFCSPLKRTFQTATIVNKYHNNKILLDPRLKEQYLGILQGRKSIGLNFDEVYNNYLEYGCENRKMVYNRVIDFINDLKKYDGKNILIVSHNGIYDYFDLIMKNKTLKDFYHISLKQGEIIKYAN